MRLPDDLRRQGFALMFVTHNLGLVPRIAQHVAVLAGPVKYRPPKEVLTRPLAPETAALSRHRPAWHRDGPAPIGAGLGHLSGTGGVRYGRQIGPLGAVPKRSAG